MPLHGHCGAGPLVCHCLDSLCLYSLPSPLSLTRLFSHFGHVIRSLMSMRLSAFRGEFGYCPRGLPLRRHSPHKWIYFLALGFMPQPSPKTKVCISLRLPIVRPSTALHLSHSMRNVHIVNALVPRLTCSSLSIISMRLSAFSRGIWRVLADATPAIVG